jgi:hypothetical protein
MTWPPKKPIEKNLSTWSHAISKNAMVDFAFYFHWLFASGDNPPNAKGNERRVNAVAPKNPNAPDDNIVLEAAEAALADAIVSDDKHLLDLKAWSGIRILCRRNSLRNGRIDRPLPVIGVRHGGRLDVP